MSEEVSARAAQDDRVHIAARLRAGALKVRAFAQSIAGQDPTGSRLSMKDADDMEERAAALLAVPGDLNRGVGGEVTLAGAIGAGLPAIAAKVEEKPDGITAEASLNRLELLDGAGAVALGLEAAESAGARDALERMVAHQLATAHRLALKLAAKAGDHIDAIDARLGGPRQQVHSVEAARLAGAATRLMNAFQQGLDTLHRRRSGGQQTILVQRVDIAGDGRTTVTGAVARHRGGNKNDR